MPSVSLRSPTPSGCDVSFAPIAPSEKRRLRVFVPSTPSADKPFFFWKARTAAFVAAPYCPSEMPVR